MARSLVTVPSNTRTERYRYNNLLGFHSWAQVHFRCVMNRVNCDVRRGRVINTSVLFQGVQS
jgi:hypothetical protein